MYRDFRSDPRNARNRRCHHFHIIDENRKGVCLLMMEKASEILSVDILGPIQQSADVLVCVSPVENKKEEP